MRRVLLVILAVAAVSLLVVRPAPGYDPWTWLLWGREVAGGGLSTVDGPAFKPLPVAVCALLAPLGGAAPWLWVALVRVAAVAACWLAFRLGRELAGGSRAAGVLAAGGVALCGGFAFSAGTGAEAPLVIAFALAGVEAWRRGRLGTALLCGAACALLRVEAWPFLAAAGVVAWRREPGARAVVAALAVAVPAAWFGPEWIGSGDPLRSGARARVPNPGQPALADVPALASLEAAAGLVWWPLWLGLLALLVTRRNRPALLLAAAGAAWIALVAAMSQAGFSGEARYHLPGVALLSIAAAAGGWAVLPANSAGNTAHPTELPARGEGETAVGGPPRRRGPRIPSVRGSTPAAAAMLAIALAAAPRIADVADLRAAQQHQHALKRDLTAAIDAAGGRAEVLACGTPYVGPLRGPLMAYALRVTKRTVEPDAPPHPPGVVFRARLTEASRPTPDARPPFRPIIHAGTWQVMAACTAN